jgi:cold shock CspA family protein
MGRSQESFNKKEVRKKKEKRRLEKEKKKLARKEGEKKSSLDDMIAYVDENGNIVDTPPDPTQKSKTKAEDIEVSIPKQDPSEKADIIRKGRLTYFNDSKGYGFIRDVESQESVFVHINEFQDDIMEGNMVTFEVEKGLKGPAAVRVKLVD